MCPPLRHVVVEGLPAVGKSEILALLARFHPRKVRVLPELVKSLVEDQAIDLFRDRGRLTQAIAEALPRRDAEIAEIVRSGFLCLEESHVGAHYAYSAALSDQGFLRAYPALELQTPRPDLYVRLDIPVAESVARQEARGTPQYAIDGRRLEGFLAELDQWHTARRTPLVVVDADRAASAVTADLERTLGLSYLSAEALDVPTFDILLLLGRPASGKSEFIDFIARAHPRDRAGQFHLGRLEIADDFPILWRTFEDDDAWERLGHSRLHSRRADGNYAVSDDRLWAFLIERLNDQLPAGPRQPEATTLVEFSRGGVSGYRDALHGLSPAVLNRAAILYLSVSFEESWRRNLARYDAKRRGGILTHSVPREEMERTYGTDDWEDLTDKRSSGWIGVGKNKVPFVTLPNEPESADPRVLEPRYRGALDALFELRREDL
jgi:thymidylate kinase